MILRIFTFTLAISLYSVIMPMETKFTNKQIVFCTNILKSFKEKTPTYKSTSLKYEELIKNEQDDKEKFDDKGGFRIIEDQLRSLVNPTQLIEDIKTDLKNLTTRIEETKETIKTLLAIENNLKKVIKFNDAKEVFSEEKPLTLYSKALKSKYNMENYSTELSAWNNISSELARIQKMRKFLEKNIGTLHKFIHVCNKKLEFEFNYKPQDSK